MATFRRARGVRLCAALFASLSLCACSSERPDKRLGEADLGAVRGELLMYVARYDDGTSQTSYALRVDGNEQDERPLIFDVDPGLASGTKLKVWGAESGEDFKVDRFELDQPDDPGTIEQGLITGMPYPARRFALVLLNLGGGVNLSNAQAQIDLFGLGPTDGSVKQYFLEASYGTQDITGEIIGPLTHSLTSCSNSATQAMANTLRAQIPGTFDHYLWYFGSRAATCGWAGLGAVGTPDRPARDTWYNAASSCVVLVQEPGHNFGMQHSSAMRCSGTPFRDDPNGCTHEEYGDRYDPMGGGCYHMNGWQKTYQGWTGKCNNVKVGASGTYTLFPLEKPCDGVQVLQIPMPRTRTFAAGGSGGNLQYYYLELRTPTGFDTRLAGAPTVLVRVAADYRTRRQIGYRTWILDMNPSTTTLDGLKAGGQFADPAGGVSFAVEAVSNEQATIRVEVQNGTGSSTCLDSSPFTPPGPASCTGLGTDGGVGGTSGTGGTNGASGTSGTAGTGGTAGASGSAGSAGTNGASGSAGSAGTNGTSGTGGGGSGGDAGSGGSVGSGGDGGAGVGGTGFGGTGAGGSGAGTPGASGAPAGGAQGNPGDPPGREGSRPRLGLSEQESGCSCTMPRSGRFDAAGLLLAVAGLLGMRRRRV